MKIVILGGRSTIGSELSVRFVTDGHEVLTWSRNEPWANWEYKGWDVVIITIGSMIPIGRFFKTDKTEWEQAFINNLFYGLRLLRDIYQYKRPGASVVFFGGPNPNIATKNYSAYTASKVALTKLVECLDEEEDNDSEADCKFMILGPGKVKTKIQNQTIEAGHKAGENYQRVKEFMKSGKSTSHDEVYEFVKTCISYPKELIGGRNISIRDDWKNFRKVGYNKFKLRRSE